MLDIEGRTKRVELVLAGRSALAQTEETIREFLAIVREYCADADRASLCWIAARTLGVVVACL